MASYDLNLNPHLNPNQLMASTAAGRKGIKEGKSGEGLRRLIERYVLSNPAKAEMQALLDAMNKDDEVAAVLHGQRSALLKRFSAIASKRKPVRAAPQPRRSRRRRRAAAAAPQPRSPAAAPQPHAPARTAARPMLTASHAPRSAEPWSETGLDP